MKVKQTLGSSVPQLMTGTLVESPSFVSEAWSMHRRLQCQSNVTGQNQDISELHDTRELSQHLLT